MMATQYIEFIIMGYVTLHSKLEDSPLGENLKEFLESEGFEVRFEEW